MNAAGVELGIYYEICWLGFYSAVEMVFYCSEVVF